MDWITKEYVKSEAAKGRRQAIECTQLHWQQLCKAGPKELQKALDNSKVEIDDFHCAMCRRYYQYNDLCNKCRKCLLQCRGISDGIWDNACNSLDDWCDNPTRANWRKWKQAAKAILAKIDRLHERLYGSKP